MTETEDPAEAPAVLPFRLRLQTRLHKVGHKAHRWEAYSHLAYFAMLISHLEYKIAASFCLLFGCIALFGGEE